VHFIINIIDIRFIVTDKSTFPKQIISNELINLSIAEAIKKISDRNWIITLDELERSNRIINKIQMIC